MCGGGGSMGMQGVRTLRDNFDSALAGATSPVAEDERKWYMDQGFGDPNEVIGKREAQYQYRMMSGRSQMPAVAASAGKYKGVSPEARYLYQQSRAPKPAPVAAPTAAAAGASGTLAVPPTSTRYAGNALTINPMSS